MKKEYISHNKQTGWEPTKYKPDTKTRTSKVSIITSQCISTQKNKSQPASIYQYHTTEVKEGMEIKYQAFNTFALHLG
jgi:hypothetical protein